MGLRLRLILIVTLGLALAVAGVLVVQVERDTKALATREAERAGALLATLVPPTAFAIVRGRVPHLDNVMAELHARRDVLGLARITAFDLQGRVIADTAGAPLGQAWPDPFVDAAIIADGPRFETDARGRPMRVSMPVQTGLRWGTLVGELSRGAVEAQVRKEQRRSALAGAGMLGTGILVLLLALSAFVFRPLKQAADATDRLAHGDFDVRVKVRGNDELARLFRTLNLAAERLGADQSRLEDAVAARTEQLEATNQKLVDANARLERLAVTDGLTGLHNHRYFQEALAAEHARWGRTGHAFAVVLMDVDHFKHYNDTQGHPAGDEVLRAVATTLKDHTRDTDVVARYGGEEFVVLLPETDIEAAAAVAEKLRAAIAALPVPHAEKQPLGALTVSAGVAACPRHAPTAEALVSAADAALYAAKHAGRNRVCEPARLLVPATPPGGIA